MSAQSKMTAGRTDLVLESPFWGSLALRLKAMPDPTCERAWVDGRTLGYNPAYIETCSNDTIKAIWAHEVDHCAMGHPWRRDGRNLQRYGKACDLAINGDLKEHFPGLPADCLYPDAQQKGKSAEWIYARLGDESGDDGQGGGAGNGPGQGQGQNKPDPLGELRDAPDGPDADGDPTPTEEEWKQATASAAQQAKLAGKLSGGLARQVERALHPCIDVRSLLLRFFSERSTGDYSWVKPNPRYLSQGLYLPALESKSLGEVTILIDTSGSVDSVSLSYARAIVESVIDECTPSAVTVCYVDADVCRVDRFAQGESLDWHPCGGGGTNFTSFFERVERGEESPVCVIGISDLDATFPPAAPSIPVLWLSTEEGVTAPFGETVYLDR